MHNKVDHIASQVPWAGPLSAIADGPLLSATIAEFGFRTYHRLTGSYSCITDELATIQAQCEQFA
jgi:hypothetical protein